MTYPCTDAILAHMEASGPQTRQQLRTECRTQAVPYNPQLFAAAIGELLTAGRIVIESDDDHDTYFDFPASYYTHP